MTQSNNPHHYYSWHLNDCNWPACSSVRKCVRPVWRNEWISCEPVARTTPHPTNLALSIFTVDIGPLACPSAENRRESPPASDLLLLGPRGGHLLAPKLRGCWRADCFNLEQIFIPIPAGYNSIHLLWTPSESPKIYDEQTVCVIASGVAKPWSCVM